MLLIFVLSIVLSEVCLILGFNIFEVNPNNDLIDWSLSKYIGSVEEKISDSKVL